MRRPLPLAVLIAAMGVLAVGVARAVDLRPGGDGAQATAASHEQHQGARAAGAPRRAGHDQHRTSGPPPAALDDGRYAMRVHDRVRPVGTHRLSFEILDGRTGRAVTRFQDDLTKKLHLIVVRESLTGFQHLHPRMEADGRWIVEGARLTAAGPWRLIADFIPAGGRRTVLSTSVHATGGAYAITPVVESPRVADGAWRARVDGYEVTASAEEFAGGRSGELRFAVRRAGRPVADLQPYLGARGHAVLLRWGDVAYVHVHPEEGRAQPGEIVFDVTYPRAAPLALFLQFRHRDRVRTARFVLPTPPAS